MLLWRDVLHTLQIEMCVGAGGEAGAAVVALVPAVVNDGGGGGGGGATDGEGGTAGRLDVEDDDDEDDGAVVAAGVEVVLEVERVRGRGRVAGSVAVVDVLEGPLDVVGGATVDVLVDGGVA